MPAEETHADGNTKRSRQASPRAVCCRRYHGGERTEESRQLWGDSRAGRMAELCFWVDREDSNSLGRPILIYLQPNSIASTLQITFVLQLSCLTLFQPFVPIG